jgi:hypothetical protein
MEMELVLAEMGTTEDMGPELGKDMTNSSSHPTVLIMHAQPVAIQKMQSYHPQTQREREPDVKDLCQWSQSSKSRPVEQSSLGCVQFGCISHGADNI